MRLIGLLLVLVVAAISESRGDSPNIVIILADDMGYGDVHVLNPASKIPTPNLDRLAAQGMTFTDAHSPSGVCTPTRYGLLTGRYCWRTERLERGVLNGYSELLIEPGRATLASTLKNVGYRTAVVGKWHLGLGWKRNTGKGVDYSAPISSGPHTVGFDEFFGVAASLDMPPYVYIDRDRVVEQPTETQPAAKFPHFIRKGPRAPGFKPEDVLDQLTKRAVQVVKAGAASGKPFFLYMPLTGPHKPVSPHERFQGKTELGLYGDFIVQVDWTVGEVVKAIDEAGLRKKTLVLFTSDNGSFMYRRDQRDAKGHVDDPSIQAFRADRHRSNHVFRGTKADIWEGGHHVPFLARWSGVVPEGSRCDETICLTDVFKTCAELAGAPVGKHSAEDSFSIVELLKGKPRSEPRAPVIHHSAAGMFAIREGRWKLVAGNGSGGREQPRGKAFGKPYQLFDVEGDVGEERNVAEQNSEIVERLIRRLEGMR